MTFNEIKRSPCPLLNSLANAKILPNNGTNITTEMLQDALKQIGISDSISSKLVPGAMNLGRVKTDDFGKII